MLDLPDNAGDNKCAQNLANTMPAIIAPIIVVAVYRNAAMPPLIWTMAGLTLASAMTLSPRVD